MSLRTQIVGLTTLVFLSMGTSYYTAAAESRGPAAAAAFEDPLNTPALRYTHLITRPLQGIAATGSRLVAVGMRGLIIVSDDGGKMWKQSQVPVQSDMLAVQFPTPEEGWAVGHNGVILHSRDGGLTWTKQLDGIAAGEAFEKYYQVKADAGDKNAESLVTSLKLDFQDGPTLPFLDVWFANTQKGFVVGAFGLFATTDDGGQHWTPALERIENPELFNLNSISKTPAGLFIAGEHGMVYKYDETANTFRRRQTGYPGSLFGVTGSDKVVLAFGLRGTIYRSQDSGATWTKVESGTSATITGGTYSSQSKTFTLVTEAGQVVVGDDSASVLHLLPAGPGGLLTNVIALDGDARCLIGIGGARVWSGF